MHDILASPWKALTVGGLVTLLLVALYFVSGGALDRGFAAFVLRWLHVLSAIVWIGLVWFVNFVQLLALQDTDDAGRATIAKFIAPRVAWWFRHAATATVIAGLALAALQGSLVAGVTFGAFEGLHTRHIMLGIGIWMGIVMWVFVHMLIWPNLKIMLGLVDADNQAKAAARLKVRDYARKNLILSVPVTFAMVAAAHAG
jgi:uncharacterized membrane protein